ncbi:u3 small nucleolar RNA-associated protein 15 homolog [Caerostris extrusa]|uniref:U3 small nucleolar RNA-associated protein 15 homolog n=1 Tax=Caerostris extrusa TaxID=172846 RepID=A0AAV4QNI5_CAEEX|nr:u3 small nucleolar RNA-associated protein 15 homolog [Caerostris extrusa]
MSGSLDRHIKIYNTTTYEVVHTLNYPSPILAVAVANDDQSVGVGMTDGLFSLRHMKKDKSAEEIKKKNTYETDFKPINVDIIVPGKKKKISKKYDTYLRKFDHRKALDAVLKNKIQDESPEITVEVLRELMRRNCIKGAMAGREGESLLPLFKFVTRYIGDVRFQGFLIDIAWILLELYGSKIRHPEIKKMIDYLNDAVNSEVELIKQHIKQEAILKMIKNSNRDENAEEPKLIIG